MDVIELPRRGFSDGGGWGGGFFLFGGVFLFGGLWGFWGVARPDFTMRGTF